MRAKKLVPGLAEAQLVDRRAANERRVTKRATASVTERRLTEDRRVEEVAPADKYFKPSRVDRKPLSSFQNTATVRQVKILAAQEETTVQALVAEALNMLFESRGLEKVANG